MGVTAPLSDPYPGVTDASGILSHDQVKAGKSLIYSSLLD